MACVGTNSGPPALVAKANETWLPLEGTDVHVTGLPASLGTEVSTAASVVASTPLSLRGLGPGPTNTSASEVGGAGGRVCPSEQAESNRSAARNVADFMTAM